MQKLILILLLWAMPAVAEMKADEIVVNKSERVLYLKQNGQTIRQYKIALGNEPIGHKQKQGDGKTPEGRYFISGRNPHSAYHLSLRISYPNAEDKKQAAQKGVSPGGDIMIHGYPNRVPNRLFDFIHENKDWTAGCIAVKDAEIEEIWKLVSNGTPIEIRP